MMKIEIRKVINQQAVSKLIKGIKNQKSKVQVLEQDSKDDEESSIVDYRGMKMTYLQREEYIQMENQ